MWQLHQRWRLQDTEDTQQQTEEVRLGSFRLRRLLILVVTLAMAVLAGYAGSRYIRPFSYAGIGLSAVGGAALALLVIIIPRQALRVLRRGFIFTGLVFRRRALRRLVRRERTQLSGAAEEMPSAALMRDLAVGEYLRGSVETAEIDLARGLELDPDNADLLNNLGVTLAEGEQHDEAASFFIRALSGDSAEDAAINCALVAPLVSDPGWLEQMMNSAGTPAHAVALNNLGAAYAHRNDWETASRCFASAAELAPDLPAARANLGLVAYQDHELQQAADSIMHANRQAPNEPDFANYLGVILADAGQPEQARAFMRRAHRVDPAGIHIRINSLAVEALGGHWGLARKGFQSLVNEDDHRADTLYNLAVTELATHEPAAAATSAAAAIAAGDTSPDAYTVLAVSLWETGRRAEALSHFQSAAASPDATAVEHSNLTRALLLNGEIEKAIAVVQAAAQRWPDDHNLQFDLATATVGLSATRFREGMSPELRAPLLAAMQRYQPMLEAVIERQAELAPEAHVNLGLYYYMQDLFETAASHFEAALRLVPKSRELQFLVGTALAREGEKQTHRTADGDTAPTAVGRNFLRRSVPFLETACESREVLLEAGHNLGRSLYALKEYDRALVAFRRVLKTETTEDLNVLAALAAARQAQRIQLLFKTQIMSEHKREQLRSRSLELLNVSVHYFRQALLRNELDPTLHGNIGIAYMLRNRQNDVEAAVRHWERMRAIGGGAMARRYAELAQMENLADPSRVGFDDRSSKLRGIDALRWLAVAPPRPCGVRFVIEPVAVQQPWRLVAGTDRLRVALEYRDRIAEAEMRLARLRV
ncbi:MAG: tetratricopeptide repeat protein [Armatimonadia bacterium]